MTATPASESAKTGIARCLAAWSGSVVGSTQPDVGSHPSPTEKRMIIPIASQKFGAATPTTARKVTPRSPRVPGRTPASRPSVSPRTMLNASARPLSQSEIGKRSPMISVTGCRDVSDWPKSKWKTTRST